MLIRKPSISRPSCDLLFSSFFSLLLFTTLSFSYHSSCRKDPFTVLILKVGGHDQDFTDPGQLKIWLTLTHFGFAFTSVSDSNFLDGCEKYCGIGSDGAKTTDLFTA